MAEMQSEAMPKLSTIEMEDFRIPGGLPQFYAKPFTSPDLRTYSIQSITSSILSIYNNVKT